MCALIWVCVVVDVGVYVACVVGHVGVCVVCVAGLVYVYDGVCVVVGCVVLLVCLLSVVLHVL